ncbi:unnamed protein product [Polarella glacialis]|uniref:Uncharacterized protein n=1 Tax=Polarella glacialis TaxID=89957 RepID=A0A813EN16_POLGL|nr:unnamed protein product [Polarella glacialis]
MLSAGGRSKLGEAVPSSSPKAVAAEPAAIEEADIAGDKRQGLRSGGGRAVRETRDAATVGSAVSSFAGKGVKAASSKGYWQGSSPPIATSQEQVGRTAALNDDREQPQAVESKGDLQGMVVGISGAPISGKSTLARELASEFSRGQETGYCTVVSQEDFRYQASSTQGGWVRRDGRWLENWEEPAATDWRSFEDAVKDAADKNWIVLA